MQNKYILGIDTSNYTTSCALMTLSGELVANVKRPLPVKNGECGLRQSDAVFAHIKNLPSAMEEVSSYLKGTAVAVGVSERPRNLDGSYMPCFLSGVSAATSIACAARIPLYRFSHQCGHIMAALYSAGRMDLLDSTFCAFHVSGGTTEMLRVCRSDSGFSAELVGGTRDLNAGQVIDRVGVLMGLPFPSGAHLERLALENQEKIPKRRISIDGTHVNLSGLENMAASYLREGRSSAFVSAFVLDYIGRSLIALSDAYVSVYGETEFLYAGGVMSNSILKKMLAAGRQASFAEPALSADNAVGIANLARLRYLSENE